MHLFNTRETWGSRKPGSIQEALLFHFKGRKMCTKYVILPTLELALFYILRNSSHLDFSSKINDAKAFGVQLKKTSRGTRKETSSPWPRRWTRPKIQVQSSWGSG